MSDHEQTLDLMPGYTLGNLSADERKLVERHVAACRECLDELKRYQAVADALPEGIVMFDPPPELKDRILSKAAQLKSEKLTVGGRHTETQSSGSFVDDRGERMLRQPSAHPTQSSESIAARLNRFLRSLSPAWNLAALALIAVLAVSNILLWGRLDRLESNTDLRTIPLTGTSFASNATGIMVISKDGEHGTLVVDDLPVLDEAHEYQVWLMKDGQRVSGGVFSVSKDGYGAVWVHAPDPLASYQSAGVTIEPAGGSPGPTGDKVLGGEL